MHKALPRTFLVALALSALCTTGIAQAPGDANLQRGLSRIEMVNEWAHYDTYGQRHSHLAVIEVIDDAAQDRGFGGLLTGWLDKATRQTQEKLAQWKKWAYSAPYGPSSRNMTLEQKRDYHRKQLRDLQRRLDALAACRACYESQDNSKIREIEKKRVEWRRTGDPLPPDPDVPQDADMRDILDSALRRLREPLPGYDAKINELVKLSHDLADNYDIFENRETSLTGQAHALDKIHEAAKSIAGDPALVSGKTQEQGDAKSGEATALSAESTVRSQIGLARSIAAHCKSAAEADSVEACYRGAQTALDAMSAAVAKATAALLRFSNPRAWKTAEGRLKSFKNRAQEIMQEAMIDEEAAAKAMQNVARAAVPTPETIGEVEQVRTALNDTSHIQKARDEWEQTLKREDKNHMYMRDQFRRVEEEYRQMASRADSAIAFANRQMMNVGDPEELNRIRGRWKQMIEAFVTAIQAVELPTKPKSDVNLQDLRDRLAAASDLVAKASHVLADAAACRAAALAAASGAGTGSAGGAGTGGTSGTGSTSGTSQPSWITNAVDPDVAGGLVITGGRPVLTVGEGMTMEGRDHGGRKYAGVTWSCSNMRVLTVDGAGNAVAQKAGDAIVMARVENLWAFLDVTVKKAPDAQLSTNGVGTATGSGDSGMSGSGESTDDGGFSDAGPATGEEEPSDATLLGQPIDNVAPADTDTAETGNDSRTDDSGFSDAGAASGESSPPGIGLLGQDTSSGTPPVEVLPQPDFGQLPNPGNTFGASPEPSAAPSGTPPPGSGQTRAGLSGTISPHKVVKRLVTPADLPPGFQLYDSTRKVDSWLMSNPLGKLPPDPEKWAVSQMKRLKRYQNSTAGTWESVTVTLIRWDDSRIPAAQQELREWIDKSNQGKYPVTSLELGDLSMGATWGGFAWVIDGNWSLQVSTWVQPIDAKKEGTAVWMQKGQQWAAYTRSIMSNAYPRAVQAISGRGLPPAQAPAAPPPPNRGINLLGQEVLEPVVNPFDPK